MLCSSVEGSLETEPSLSREPSSPDKQATLTDLLRKSAKELPQSSFVDNVVELSHGCTEAILGAREELIQRAKAMPGCPSTQPIARRKTQRESDDHL